MWQTTLILTLLCTLSFFAGLGRPAIGDSDEAFYAEAGREMVESGDWLTPHYNYETRFQKPILFYWLVAGTYTVAGVNEAAARFWSAMAGLGLALVTAACGRTWYDERTARLAGAVVATAFGYFSIGRLSLPDLPLAFFLTLTVWAAIRGLVDDVARPTMWLVLAGTAAGLGFLTKGPVALVLPTLVVAPVWWIERRSARIPLRGLAAGALVAAIVGAPWYAAMAHVHGQAYLESFFVGDNLDRFATARFNEPRPFWFYVPIVAGGMLPWTPLMACAAGPAIAWARRRTSSSTTAVRLLLWAMLPLLFFTISIGKQPRYVLPILPPLAVLLARAVHRRLATHEEATGGSDHLLRGSALLIGLLLAVLGALIYRAMPLIVMVDRRLVLAGAALIVLAGAGVSIGAYLLRRDRIPAAVALAGALVLAGLQYALSPAGRDPVQDMATLVRAHHEGHEPVATFRVFVRNLIFYTHMKQTDLPSDEALRSFLQRPERVLCVMTADELARIDASADLQVRTLAEVLYFNASAVKLRTLLSPDPARDLERVLLVTNR